MIKISGAILVFLLLLILIYFLRSEALENFIVFVDDVVIPASCYNYLVSNGKNYFLLNTKKIIDGITNPLTFKTKLDAVKYLKTMKCPVDIPFVDLVMKKSNDDPTISYERQCNKKISTNLFNLDVCSQYGSDNDTLSKKYLNKLNKIENDKKIFADYNLETCMIDQVMKEDPKLDDSNFRTYFSQYFNNLNTNIDEKFLYITE
jgi:hypothetical protein